MQVQVVGSWRKNAYWPTRGSHEEFAAACRQLGDALVRQGHSIIVDSDSESTADYHIVKGAAEAAKELRLTSKPIRILRYKRDNIPFTKLRTTQPEHVAFTDDASSWWEAQIRTATKVADAVLVVGGGDGTFGIGLASFLTRGSCVPLGSFGGSAERLHAMVVAETRNDRDALDSLMLPWSDHVRGTALALLTRRARQKVLLIHGRSEDWRDVKDFLQNKLNLPEPVIMQQVPAEGRALIEKFEDIAGQVSAAIVVATPDDVGGPKGDAQVDRARQNVWLETGWFWGRLGRPRIMVLVKGRVEIPTDLSGLEYYTYQNSPSEQWENVRTFIERLR